MNTLTASEFSERYGQGDVLESDAHGVKVIRLPNDRILKLFRRKRTFSSQIWAPHAARFTHNAEILRDRGIQTIDVETHFTIPEMERQALIYRAVPGVTLRERLQQESTQESAKIIESFAHYFAHLHAKGILFRSLHLGNVIITNDDQFALIDIVDMGFNAHRGLNTFQRMRNFNHLARYLEDRKSIAESTHHDFLETYLKAAKLSPLGERTIRWNYRRQFQKNDS